MEPVHFKLGSHIALGVAQTELGMASQIHQSRCLSYDTVIIAPIKLSDYIAGGHRYVSGKTVEAMETESGLVQRVAGTRYTCEHNGERVERGNGQQ